MKTQQEINDAWLVTQGGITFLEPLRRESGLRKPYQYKLSESEILSLKAALKKAIEPWKAKLQCDLIDFKRTGLGFRLNIFLLGHTNTWTGMTSTGVTAEEWSAAVDAAKTALKPLDADAPVYAEPWTSERKFQARFETYILRA